MAVAVLIALAAAASILTVAALAARLPGGRFARWLPVGVLVLLMAAAAVATALGSRTHGRAHAVVVILALVAAVIGGNHVTGAVFEAVDAGQSARADLSLRSAGEVLRGGLWIGLLERAAVFATLVARWPEGIAVVLAVKGLGRYPELRTGHRPALAERFIIGTLVSVLWAGLCVYAATGPALG
jgi:hypothetical protein